MKRQVTNPYLPLTEYIPDGEPRVFGDRVYIYGSHDRFNGDFYCLDNYVGWSAPVDDLTNWRYEGVIYKKIQDPLIENGLKSNFTESQEPSMFAPDVVQGPDGRFYMFYGIDFISQISVAVCDKPCGKYEYYGVIKYNDGITFGSKEEDPFLFDPGVLVDSDNKVFLYTGFSPKSELIEKFRNEMNISLKGEGNNVVHLEKDMMTIKTGPKNLLPGWKNSEGTGFEGHEFFEASSIRKFDSTYYLIYSSILSHELAYAKSRYPDKDFEFVGSLHSNGGIIPGLSEEETNYWGNNHGSIQKINDQFYVFGHRQTNYTEFSRQGVAEKLTVNDNGLFDLAEMTSCGLNDGPLQARRTYSAGIACELYAKDGAMKSIAVSEKDKQADHPCITQEKEEHIENPYQLIKNIRQGTIVGFKYFMYDNPDLFSIIVRGSGNGVIRVKLAAHSYPFIEIPITPSFDWQKISSTILNELNGIHGLYLEYRGNGYIDFKEFSFLNKELEG